LGGVGQKVTRKKLTEREATLFNCGGPVKGAPVGGPPSLPDYTTAVPALCRRVGGSAVDDGPVDCRAKEYSRLVEHVISFYPGERTFLLVGKADCVQLGYAATNQKECPVLRGEFQ